MRILVASDSFKDGCTSIEACHAIANGILSAQPTAHIDICPISDGGEGTVEILQQHCGGQLIEVAVSNPLFKVIKAQYLMMENGVAFIEMAQASGLELLSDQERNPMNTSSSGTGELIMDVLNRGCNDVIISVGGSATNDLGMGMLSALGYQFLDLSGNYLAPIGSNMSNVVKVDSAHMDKRLIDTSFTVITDVNNPLYGPQGAAHVFGAQKGASKESIKHLERGVKHLWSLISRGAPNLSNETLGYGAAGGLSAGCVALLHADIQSGIAKISELINLQSKIKQADVIITGEGHLDSQTLNGKVISGIASMSSGKKLVVFCGKNSLTDEACKSLNISQVIEINSRRQQLKEALAQTVRNLNSNAVQWATINL